MYLQTYDDDKIELSDKLLPFFRTIKDCVDSVDLEGGEEFTYPVNWPTTVISPLVEWYSHHLEQGDFKAPVDLAEYDSDYESDEGEAEDAEGADEPKEGTSAFHFTRKSMMKRESTLHEWDTDFLNAIWDGTPFQATPENEASAAALPEDYPLREVVDPAQRTYFSMIHCANFLNTPEMLNVLCKHVAAALKNKTKDEMGAILNKRVLTDEEFNVHKEAFLKRRKEEYDQIIAELDAKEAEEAQAEAAPAAYE
jgi:BMFP domain-containing protein YqiC